MLWLIAAVLSFFWFFGWVIGSLGLFIHIILLAAVVIGACCLIAQYKQSSSPSL